MAAKALALWIEEQRRGCRHHVEQQLIWWDQLRASRDDHHIDAID
jgi:hypothetical protein